MTWFSSNPRSVRRLVIIARGGGSTAADYKSESPQHLVFVGISNRPPKMHWDGMLTNCTGGARCRQVTATLRQATLLNDEYPLKSFMHRNFFPPIVHLQQLLASTSATMSLLARYRDCEERI